VFFIPHEIAAAWAASQNRVRTTVTSGTAVPPPPPVHDPTDPAWGAWQATMRDYSNAANSDGLTHLNFWLVVSLPADSFSEKLEWHSEIPMLVPVSGTGKLLGLAQGKDDLDAMLHEDRANVHLTYKVKIQGQNAWRDLLEFLAEHNMLEKE